MALTACFKLPLPAVLKMVLPSLTRLKATSVWLKAKRLTMSEMLANSVARELKYLSRAGVLKKRSVTVIFVPVLAELGCCLINSPPLISTSEPALSAWVLVSKLTWLTEAILGKASPRKPKVFTLNKSARSVILLVACRRKAIKTSAWLIPSPLSITWIDFKPASST